MAQIVLVTGKPRIGKTAFVVDMIMHEEDYKGRKLFSNINGLKLPHHQPPEGHSWEDMYEWLKWEENIGSLVVFDEVQDLYPKRYGNGKMPPNVSFLNVHGHYGIDMIFITQSPKIIDLNLKEVVNKHIHITANQMGGLTRLEWNEAVTNTTSEAKRAVSSVHKINKEVFDYYKSAEVHSHNKKVRSRWWYVLVFGPLVVLFMLSIVGYMGWRTYQGFKAKGNAQTSQQQAQTESEPSGNPVSDIRQATQVATSSMQGENGNLTPEMFVPTLAERPESKPLYNGVRQVRQFERVAACIDGGESGCACYTDQATKVREVPEALCRQYASEGLPFNPYKEARQETAAPQQPTAADGGSPSVLSLDGQSKTNLAYAHDAPLSAQ
ncbi:hypothetical protein H9Q10_10515 [Eikenella sp. S3360]|uniref:Zona occludens toxin N-terminal domain-containing protein n=1 Tax=Eikenella glucosivorans TaxID=2766967 RepID=A0ABS0NCP5_9NEIS|nr:zonular occludens toxin domain-containing protein [Eikenella glucosivorans]MBH5330096.1 hypothetical protein [Eikenella glucosivorans]